MQLHGAAIYIMIFTFQKFGKQLSTADAMDLLKVTVFLAITYSVQC